MKQAAGKVQFHNKEILPYREYTEGSVGESFSMIADVHRRNASCLESAPALWLVADCGKLQLKVSTGFTSG